MWREERTEFVRRGDNMGETQKRGWRREDQNTIEMTGGEERGIKTIEERQRGSK